MSVRRLAFLAVVLSAACASTPRQPPATAVPPALPPPTLAPAPVAPGPAAVTGLAFAVEPRDAQIAVDGEPRGTVADLAAAGGVLVLPPGIYQVSLKSAGHQTWRAEVAVRSSVERIDVKLVKKP